MAGAKQASAAGRIHRFAIAMERRASVTREIEIEGAATLHDFAAAIVAAFGFDFDHAFGFYTGLTRSTMHKKAPRYELFVDMGEADEESGALSVGKIAVEAAFRRPRQTLLFLFDYGDEWLFRVKLLAVGEAQAGARYPRLVASKGKAPPQYAVPVEG